MFRIHTAGDWLPRQVRVSRTTSTRRIESEVEARIDAAWGEAQRRPGVRLFDGPMCRLESWRATPELLELAVSPTSYKPFLGTNLANSHLADRFGPGVMANPVGVSTALVTGDGFFLLGRRNAAVAYYPGRVHPFAGSLEPADGNCTAGPDPFTTVYRELGEELNLAPDEITELRCAGLVEDAALRQPELIFRARTPRARADIESRLDPAEHHALWATAAEPGALESALRDPALTPVAAATVLLWGRAVFGERWFTVQAGRW